MIYDRAADSNILSILPQDWRKRERKKNYTQEDKNIHHIHPCLRPAHGCTLFCEGMK